MNVNLELYKVFCEVAKHKNISKTAENMYLSQSAVTQSIQKLEQILGAKLFFRNKNGVELTEEGKNLFEYVSDSIETVNNAENIFSQYVNLQNGKIRIGGGKILVEKYILSAVIEFIKKYPNIKIEIGRCSTQNAMKKLANGELDIAVLNLSDIPNEYSNIQIKQLKSNPRYCFYSTKDYAEKNNIKNITDLNEKGIIIPKSLTLKQHFNEFCEENGIDIKINYEIEESDIMDRLVLGGCGVGFSNIEYKDEILKNEEIVILKEIKLGRDNKSIATLKDNFCSKATLELVKFIMEVNT